jgi:hypothetical protein
MGRGLARMTRIGRLVGGGRRRVRVAEGREEKVFEGTGLNRQPRKQRGKLDGRICTDYGSEV